jgi:dipeptidase
MKHNCLKQIFVIVLLFLSLSGMGISLSFSLDEDQKVYKCNSFMVGKMATEDGSVLCTQTAGTAKIWKHPAKNHDPEEMREIKCYNEYDMLRIGSAPPVRSGPVISIPEIDHTYAYVEGDWWPLMNEHQVSFGETTLGGCRKELATSKNSDAILKLTDVTKIAAERAATAREAIDIIGSLMVKYGFNPWGHGSGEFLSIADENEVWAFEVIPVGPNWKNDSGEPGAAWCAMLIPDDMFAPSCNESIIGEIDLVDKDRFKASSNVKSLAVKHGWWDPQNGDPFRWDMAYWGKKANNLRTWRALSLVAPSQGLKPYAEEYPIPIKPDKKLSILDIRKIYADQYQGTEFDRTKGLAAGPFGNPWWPQGTPNKKGSIPDATGPSIVINQSRNWLPDLIGGITWVGLGGWGDTCVYIPFYVGITRVPKSFSEGIKTKFSWDSAYWLFNLVGYWVRLNYHNMIEDVKLVQNSIEKRELRRIQNIDEEAWCLYKTNPDSAIKFLNKFCTENADEIFTTWMELASYLISWYAHNTWYAGPIEAPDWWQKELLRNHK